MITKERLKKLIEKGATIYSNEYGEIQLIKENDLSLYENGQNNYILYALEPNKKYHNEIFDEDLFETKEEAEFSSEFQNITRTETLNLPTWKKFKKDESFQFSDKYGSDWDLYIYSSGIIVLLNGNKTYYFNNSKQGYLEACKIAKKLFLGGE